MDAEFSSSDISKVPVERITEFLKDLINTFWILFFNGDLSKPSAPAETNGIFLV